MLKRFEEESINIIKRIYKDIDNIQILYLVRDRPVGGSDLGLKSSKQKLIKGLRDHEYHYYKSTKTPKLLFVKKLLIKKETYSPNTEFPGIKIKTKPLPFAYKVEPNKELIQKVIDQLDRYLLGEYDDPTKLSEPIQKSERLQLLRSGEAFILYKDNWLKFCDIDLVMNEENEITSNIGKLLNALIKRKKIDESSCLYSEESIAEELNLASKELDNAINHLRRRIRDQEIDSMSEEHKVDVRKPRNSKNIRFINIVQDKDKFEELNPPSG
jgi:hypothetical protein